jgi:hypothetical protein
MICGWESKSETKSSLPVRPVVTITNRGSAAVTRKAVLETALRMFDGT